MIRGRARKALAVILRFCKKHEFTLSGGEIFYSGAAWKERGESWGQRSDPVLHLLGCAVWRSPARARCTRNASGRGARCLYLAKCRFPENTSCILRGPELHWL